jgi:hypothetical protein
MSSIAKHIERERELRTTQILVDVETLSCIEECLPNPPKHDCRKAHQKKYSMSQLQQFQLA